MSDKLWNATLERVQSEFEEMPCIRITPAEAAGLFGLPLSASASVLEQLAGRGVLSKTADGVYLRRTSEP